MTTRDHSTASNAIWLAALLWAGLLQPATAQQAPPELAPALGDARYRYRGKQIKRTQFATMFTYVFNRCGTWLPNGKLMDCRERKSNKVRVLEPSSVTSQAGILVYIKVIHTYPHGIVVQACTRKGKNFTAYMHVDPRIAQDEFDLPSPATEGQSTEKRETQKTEGAPAKPFLRVLDIQSYRLNKPSILPPPNSYPLVVRNGRYQSPDGTAVYPRFDALGQMTEESFSSWLKGGAKLYHKAIRKQPATGCKTCAGSGKVAARKAGKNRMGWNKVVCRRCRGRGKLTVKPRKIWTSSWGPDDVIPPK